MSYLDPRVGRVQLGAPDGYPRAQGPESGIVRKSSDRSDSAKRSLCDFHPPISKGGSLTPGRKRPISGDLRMHGRSVRRFHEHLQDHRLVLFVESVQNTLNVFRTETRQHLLRQIERRLRHGVRAA